MIRKPKATPTATGIKKLRSESAEHSSAVKKNESKRRKLVRNAIKQKQVNKKRAF